MIGFIAGIAGSKNEISKNTILFWETGGVRWIYYIFHIFFGSV